MSSRHGNQKVTDKEIVDTLESIDEPVASASEMAARLDITRTSANIRLNKLLERDFVGRKDVGNGYVWWVESESES
jgi:predicted transcriptional regulator